MQYFYEITLCASFNSHLSPHFMMEFSGPSHNVYFILYTTPIFFFGHVKNKNEIQIIGVLKNTKIENQIQESVTVSGKL